MAIKIMLDAGHFANYNASTIYPNYKEGNMTWDLQQYLKKELEEYGFVVGTTRINNDVDMEEYSRGVQAKGYDIFLSLHSNTCGDKNVDKVVIIKGHDQSDGVSINLAKELTKTMRVNQTYQIITKTKSNNDELHGVLRGAKAVGVNDRYIIEYGFHTNPYTAKWLCETENVKKLAVTTAKVIADYYGYEKEKTPINKPIPSDTSISKTISKIPWKNGDYDCKVRTTTNVNLRSGRGINHNVISIIPKGTVFNLEYVNNNWGSTWNFNDSVGYICCDYIEKI